MLALRLLVAMQEEEEECMGADAPPDAPPAPTPRSALLAKLVCEIPSLSAKHACMCAALAASKCMVRPLTQGWALVGCVRSETVRKQHSVVGQVVVVYQPCIW
jgi:hypothetical protein